MCPKTNPKSLPDSVGLVIRPEQFLNCKKQECHYVPGNVAGSLFTSHQICLSLVECGIDLIPSCTSRGNLKKAGSQGGVPFGCRTGYKIICFFFLVYPATRAWSVCVHNLKAEWFAFDGTDTKTDIWIVLKEVKVVLFLQTGAVKNTLSKNFQTLFPFRQFSESLFRG